MRDDDYMAIRELRTLATSVIGFHELADNPELTLSTVARVRYEAEVYAGGVALARKLFEVFGSAEPGRHP